MNSFENTTAVPYTTALGGFELLSIKVIIPAAIILLASTVFLLSSEPDYSVSQGGEKVRIAPYNLPFVGHIVAAIWDLDAFLRSNR